jgi:hypothetical protein
MPKPEYTFGGDTHSDLRIYSPDETKSVLISLTNDGVLTANGIPIVLEYRAGYEEVVYSGNKTTNVTIWTDNTKVQKIREQAFSYSGNNITQVITSYYDGAGVVSKTMTEIIVYDAQGKTTSITRSIV